MAIQLPLFFRNALERLRPTSFADEVSALTHQAFDRLHRMAMTLEGQVDLDLAMALHDERRKTFQDEANRRYIDLFDTLLALQALADKHKKKPDL